MIRKTLSILFVTTALFVFGAGQATAASSININSAEWLGSLKLDKDQLAKIKKAVESALTAPIDVYQQCGAVRQDCEVRAAREWSVDGDSYREIVIYIHTIGHSSRTVAQTKGKWPTVTIK